jgi:predicted nucleic acid-binding protein
MGQTFPPDHLGCRPAADCVVSYLIDTNVISDRVLPVDQLVADEWGRMSAKRIVSLIDALLAATAKVHRMTLATRNLSDVADLGADILNPFGPAAGDH